MTEIRAFVSSDYRHPYVSENQTLGSDFRPFLKTLYENQTVIESLKSTLVWISDIHCSGVLNNG